jgi:hypothetical protein
LSIKPYLVLSWMHGVYKTPYSAIFGGLSFLLQFWIDGSQLTNFAVSDFS